MNPHCCVVGAGPAGVMLATLLARQGVRVILLEARDDFDRDFRGDTLHASTLEVLDEIGMADDLLSLPHNRIEQAVLDTPAGQFVAADFRRLKTKFPYVALMPQAKFLEFVVAHAKQYDGFEIRMGANVRELLREDDRIVGVRYQDDGGDHEVRAGLVVACDGRFSRLRKQSGLPLTTSAPPMDVLWFRLPRDRHETTPPLMGRIGAGRMALVLPRQDHYQIGYVILKGAFSEMRKAGLDAFKAEFIATCPGFAESIDAITDWKQIAPLCVEASCLERWHLPGLLLIGDAAHVMSPVGGVGINYAIQDAVAAANILVPEFLKEEPVAETCLAAVQRRRQWPTRFVQRFQSMIQRRVIRAALDPTKPFRTPWFLRLPWLRDLPARVISFGVRRERVT